MKLQTTAANKEDEYDLGEDEDQPESEEPGSQKQYDPLVLLA